VLEVENARSGRGELEGWGRRRFIDKMNKHIGKRLYKRLLEAEYASGRLRVDGLAGSLVGRLDKWIGLVMI
jgi:hypothetical protein